MEVTFLGTGGAVPTIQRNTSSILLRREGERFLFDVGEGTQRQMMRFETGFGVSAIFLTHMHADHVLGLPGLLQTMEFNDRTDPLSIYVPAGTRGDIEELLDATATDPSYPLTIRNICPGDTALEHDEYTIQTFETDHRTRSIGYALVERDRKGRFDRERAEELGVPVGPKFRQLHQGTPVELDDGTVIDPEQVVGPPRPGRRVVYTGDTRPTASTESVATNADLLIHDAMFTHNRVERAQQTRHSTVREAAKLAVEADVERLALTHISSRYATDIEPLAESATDIFGSNAFFPDNGDSISIQYDDVRSKG
ncbi:ribonuclease Z (plasmid) [Halomicrobium sp. IBSBa]|uniref:ribonuclease Z n=1 Tax=Halomicrobium sp. IBSBa TaxID=2778916 RepID=UPI001ABEE973|nr:ribonuclease Z [Halomicrobium sp. IBSBa]MBO4248996.1 ribonuclease Z [Halomicrobium sp. IBSBa]